MPSAAGGAGAGRHSEASCASRPTEPVRGPTVPLHPLDHCERRVPGGSGSGGGRKGDEIVKTETWRILRTAPLYGLMATALIPLPARAEDGRVVARADHRTLTQQLPVKKKDGTLDL